MHLSLLKPHPPLIAPHPYNTLYQLSDVPLPDKRAPNAAEEAAAHPWLAGRTVQTTDVQVREGRRHRHFLLHPSLCSCWAALLKYDAFGLIWL
jgi:hypothetical protein